MFPSSAEQEKNSSLLYRPSWGYRIRSKGIFPCRSSAPDEQENSPRILLLVESLSQSGARKMRAGSLVDDDSLPTLFPKLVLVTTLFLHRMKNGVGTGCHPEASKLLVPHQVGTRGTARTTSSTCLYFRRAKEACR